MVTFSVCILKPKGPLHLGQREGMREGTETIIHSDTLFSAFCHSFLLLYGRQALEDLLSSFQTDPPIRLSSAFYFHQGRYYFPVSLNQLPQDKDQKKIRLVEKKEFENLLAGKPIDEATASYKLPDGAIKTHDVPKVTVARLTGTAAEEGGFYHLGQVWLKDTAFFFIYNVHPNWDEKFKGAVRLMCDEGVGGYRAIGKGQFEQPEFRQIDVQSPPNSDAQIMLSLYYPAPDETAGLADGYYQLLPRRGYVFSPENRSYRRKTVLLFAEGSVFPGVTRKGMLIDVTPENVPLNHRVYRYGLAFALPCMLKPERRQK